MKNKKQVTIVMSVFRMKEGVGMLGGGLGEYKVRMMGEPISGPLYMHL